MCNCFPPKTFACIWLPRNCVQTYRLVEETLARVLVLLVGTVEEAVAEGAVVDAAVPASWVRGWACKALHPIAGARTFCKKERETYSSTEMGCRYPVPDELTFKHKLSTRKGFFSSQKRWLMPPNRRGIYLSFDLLYGTVSELNVLYI